MKELFVGGEPLLESVSLWEPGVIELREKVQSALKQAAIPLTAYAAEYEKYLELHNLDINNYLKYVRSSCALITHLACSCCLVN